MESCFPCPAGLPFRPVRSGGRLYRIESARTFPIISRFGTSDTITKIYEYFAQYDEAKTKDIEEYIAPNNEKIS